jgi:tetratricopeptide (TPR) repeat protein
MRRTGIESAKKQRRMLIAPVGLRYVVWGCLLIWIGRLAVLPSVARAAGEAEREYAKGIVEYSNGNYVDAREHFRRAVELEPDNPDAQFYFGLTLSRTGEFQDAIAALQRVLQLDASRQYVHHNLGLAYFFTKRYEKALTQFQLAEQFDPQKATTQFYLGYTHYQLQQYDQALEPFQQALKLDPALAASAHYYQGLTLYALERDDQAQEALDAVVAADPTTPVAQNAQRYLDAIKRRARERQLFQAQGSIGYIYDSNVTLTPNDIEIPTGRSDAGMTFALLGKVVPLRTPRWRAGVAYRLFQSAYFSLSEFDLQSHTGEVFARYKTDRVTLYMPVNYNFTLLDFTRFSQAVTIFPRATIRQTKALFADVSLRYRYNDFFGDLPPGQVPAVRDRNGWNLGGGVDQYVAFNQGRSLVRVSYFFDSSRNDGSDWEYNSHHVGLGLQTALWAGFTLNADFGYTYRGYLNINSFSAIPLGELTAADTQERRDDRLVGAIGLTKTLGRFFFLSFNYVYISNKSNIDFFDYDRGIVSLAFTGRY